jgi:cytochrome P450
VSVEASPFIVELIPQGPFVRIGPNRLSINSNTAIKQIYGFRSNVKKSTNYNVFPANYNAPSVHTAIDKIVHARKRRILSHGFSDNAMRELEPQLMACTNTFVAQIYNQNQREAPRACEEEMAWSQPYDLAMWSNNLMFDVMGALVFSKSYGMLESPKLRWIQNSIQDSTKLKYVLSHFQILLHTGLDRFFFPSLSVMRAMYKKFAIGQLKERMEAGKSGAKQDLIGFMMRAKDPETGEGFSIQELGSEASLLITAGKRLRSNNLSSTNLSITHRIRYLLHCSCGGLLLSHPQHRSASKSNTRGPRHFPH